MKLRRMKLRRTKKVCQFFGGPPCMFRWCTSCDVRVFHADQYTKTCSSCGLIESTSRGRPASLGSLAYRASLWKSGQVSAHQDHDRRRQHSWKHCRIQTLVTASDGSCRRHIVGLDVVNMLVNCCVRNFAGQNTPSANNFEFTVMFPQISAFLFALCLHKVSLLRGLSGDVVYSHLVRSH